MYISLDHLNVFFAIENCVVIFQRTNVLTNQLKIFMHLNSTSKPMHIDAIELHGVSQKGSILLCQYLLNGH